MNSVTWGWVVWVLVIGLVIAGAAYAQQPAMCVEGVCTVPQKELLDLLYYLQHLEKIVEGKCA
jgi:hypothetical protein